MYLVSYRGICIKTLDQNSPSSIYIFQTTKKSCLIKGYVKERLKPTLWKFVGRYEDLVKQNEVLLSRMFHAILVDGHMQWHPPSIKHYTKLWPCNRYCHWLYFDFLSNHKRCQKNISNGCVMPTEDAYSSIHLWLACDLMLIPITPKLV